MLSLNWHTLVRRSPRSSAAVVAGSGAAGAPAVPVFLDTEQRRWEWRFFDGILERHQRIRIGQQRIGQ